MGATRCMDGSAGKDGGGQQAADRAEDCGECDGEGGRQRGGERSGGAWRHHQIGGCQQLPASDVAMQQPGTGQAADDVGGDHERARERRNLARAAVRFDQERRHPGRHREELDRVAAERGGEQPRTRPAQRVGADAPGRTRAARGAPRGGQYDDEHDRSQGGVHQPQTAPTEPGKHKRCAQHRDGHPRRHVDAPRSERETVVARGCDGDDDSGCGDGDGDQPEAGEHAGREQGGCRVHRRSADRPGDEKDESGAEDAAGTESVGGEAARDAEGRADETEDRGDPARRDEAQSELVAQGGKRGRHFADMQRGGDSARYHDAHDEPPGGRRGLRRARHPLSRAGRGQDVAGASRSIAGMRGRCAARGPRRTACRRSSGPPAAPVR